MIFLHLLSFCENRFSRWLLLISFMISACVIGNSAVLAQNQSSSISASSVSTLSNIGPNTDLPVHFDMLTSMDATSDAEQLVLGVRARLDSGWKIYWRSPGDAGLPPILTLDKQMSSSYQVSLDFPVPERFSIFGIDSFGYAESVIFPLHLSGHSASQPLHFSAQIEGLVCSDICIPFTDRLVLDLPAGSARPTAQAQDIAKAISLVPRTQNPVLSKANVSVDERDNLLLVEILSADRVNVPPILDDIFIETALPGFSFSAPERRGEHTYMLQVNSGDPAELIGNELTLTLASQTHIAEIASYVQASDVSPPEDNPMVLFATMLGIAFVGGVILNVMPCVLPVLLLKLNNILSVRTNTNTATMRFRLLVGASGIVTSFMLLASMLALLSVFGAQLGWGVQFQNIVFLSCMAVLMTVFSLSLFDRFHFPIPSFVQTYALSKNKFFNDFMSGFLATLLATPCSAPFVGTAVSFAFAASPAELFSILMMMGLGLASPWLCLALFPGCLHLMPTPGKWMNGLKVLMGMGLMGTVCWLIWLIWLQAGIIAVLGLLAMMLLMSWMLLSPQSLSTRSRAVSFLAVSLIALMLPYSVMQAGLAEKKPARALGSHALSYQPYSPALLEQALSSGRPVFVDVTAAWCITCQVNKKLVLDDPDISAAFLEQNVFLIQADWTETQQDIADFLAAHGRFAIPFNLFYAANGRASYPLPEILTKEVVLTALDKSTSAF